jgi:hypothetical protein
MQSLQNYLSLDTLYKTAIEKGFRVELCSKALFSGLCTVELSITNKNGSRFVFKGSSPTSIEEAFVQAFEEARVL